MADLSTERIDTLLSELDFIARDYDMYEYGLPMHGADEDDGPINKLREAVRKWATDGVLGVGANTVPHHTPMVGKDEQ